MKNTTIRLLTRKYFLCRRTKATLEHCCVSYYVIKLFNVAITCYRSTNQRLQRKKLNEFLQSSSNVVPFLSLKMPTRLKIDSQILKKSKSLRCLPKNTKIVNKSKKVLLLFQTLTLPVLQRQTLETGKPVVIKLVIGKFIKGKIVRRPEQFSLMRGKEPIQREGTGVVAKKIKPIKTVVRCMRGLIKPMRKPPFQDSRDKP